MKKEAPFMRFQRNYSIDQLTGCWNWTGDMMTGGYGRVKCWGFYRGAHQLSYELHNGPIPSGMHILHSCDNKRCVNPDHLSIGTHAENMAEAGARGRMRRGADHHAFGRPNPRKGINCNQSRPVLVLGVPYGSIKEAESVLDLGSGSVAHWIKTKSPKARDITREEYFELMEHKNERVS